MRESSKAALCGIVSALSVVIMLSTYLSPFLVYTAPVFSGLLLLPVIFEIGYKWAAGTYLSVCLISAFVVADKEAAVFYAMFFGFYPILGFFLNKNIKNLLLRYFIKLSAFNACCIISFLLCMYVLALDMSDFSEDGIIFTIFFALLMNVLFLAYDVLFMRLQQLYILRFQKKFRKLFNIR